MRPDCPADRSAASCGCMKIDIHTHILPRDWPSLAERYGYGGFLRIEHFAPCRARLMVDDKFFREIEANCWDTAVRLRDCDRAGVGIQALSTVPVMFCYWAQPEHALDLSKLLNDHIAEIVANRPDRFVGLGTIPMQDTALAIRELERCVTPRERGGCGFAGVQIGTNVNGRNLDDPDFRPIYEAAQQLGAAVFVHPWAMLGGERTAKYWMQWLVGMPAETCVAICSMIFGGVFEQFPRLRVCFAHGGGSFPGTIGRIDHGFHARPDLCAIHNAVSPREYLAQPGSGRPARFFVDSLVHDAAALRSLLALFGDRRVALGSDYPFPLGEETPGNLVEQLTDLSPETRRRVLFETPAEFLGIDVAPRPAERSARDEF